MGGIWWETEGGREEAARVFLLSPLSLEWQPQQRLCLPHSSRSQTNRVTVIPAPLGGPAQTPALIASHNAF